MEAERGESKGKGNLCLWQRDPEDVVAQSQERQIESHSRLQEPETLMTQIRRGIIVKGHGGISRNSTQVQRSCRTSRRELRDRRDNVADAQKDLRRLQDLAGSSQWETRKLTMYSSRKAQSDRAGRRRRRCPCGCSRPEAQQAGYRSQGDRY